MVRMSAPGSGAGSTAWSGKKPSLPMLAPPSSGPRIGSRPSSAGSVEASPFGDFGDFATGPTTQRPGPSLDAGHDDLFGSMSASPPPPQPQQSSKTVTTSKAQPPIAAPGAPLSQQDLSFFESL